MDSYGCLDPVAASVHISDKKQGKQLAWTFSNRSDFRLDNHPGCKLYAVYALRELPWASPS